MGQAKIGKSWYLIVVEDMTDQKYNVIGDNSCPEISHAKLTRDLHSDCFAMVFTVIPGLIIRGRLRWLRH